VISAASQLVSQTAATATSSQMVLISDITSLASAAISSQMVSRISVRRLRRRSNGHCTAACVVNFAGAPPGTALKVCVVVSAAPASVYASPEHR
jgi:hypothetical protein